jgi:hypothetical protein
MGAIILSFLLGVSLVLIVLVTIKVSQIYNELGALSDRVIELEDEVQEFKECFEEDIEEIYADIDELKDSIELLEDDSHPPVSEEGATQIEKLKKAFKKVMRK